MKTADACPRERRLALRMLARGEDGLAEALLAVKGAVFGGRYRIESLFAVGGEGAVFLVSDLQGGAADGARADLVGKIALHPVHRPFDLDVEGVRDRRRGMRVEARLLETNGSAWMPASVGTFQCTNASLPVSRGGAFAEAEPVLVMERLPGHDLDRWLVRAHERKSRRDLLQPVLDRIAIDLLRAVADLRRRGFHYADLRPGNLRILRRPERHIRLMDAGSLVAVTGDRRYPHVPAYLPPALFEATSAGRDILPDDAAIAVMAGRTLFEVATGERPFPGEDPDATLLDTAPVSPDVADTIARLCAGSYPDVAAAATELAAALGVPVDGAPERRASIREALRPTSGPAAKAKRGGWALDGFLTDDVAGLPSAAAAAPPAPPVPVERRSAPPRIPDSPPKRAAESPSPRAPEPASPAVAPQPAAPVGAAVPMTRPVSTVRSAAPVIPAAPAAPAAIASSAPMAPPPRARPPAASHAAPAGSAPAASRSGDTGARASAGVSPAPKSAAVPAAPTAPSAPPRTAPTGPRNASENPFAGLNRASGPLPPPSVKAPTPTRPWWRRLLDSFARRRGA